MYDLNFLQQSSGSGVLADGRLADLIRRVATFGMVLLKLDLRQVCLAAFNNEQLALVLCSDLIFQSCRNLVDMLKHSMQLLDI